MAEFLGFESVAGHLLLESADSLLLEVQDATITVTFPLFVVDISGALAPWEGTTFPLFTTQLLAQLGDINTIGVTFGSRTTGTAGGLGPPFIFIGGELTNTVGVTFGLFVPALFGVNNLQVGSGIYQVVINKTHDKYYQDVVTQTFVDAKIPDPFAQTALLHNESESVIHIASYKIRVSGSCILQSTLFTMGSVRSQSLANITVTSGLNREPTQLANLSTNRIMLRIQTDAIDEVFDVSRIIMYLRDLWKQRPMGSVIDLGTQQILLEDVSGSILMENGDTMIQE